MADSTDPFSASMLHFQTPEQMRAFAEKGMSQARESYSRLKNAAETQNDAIEAVFTSVSKGAGDYSAKLFDIVKSNTEASFELAQGLVGAKTLPEAFDLWSQHARKQVETVASQTKELVELTQKVANDTVEPIKAGASKLFTSPAA
jgi:phasin